MANGTATEGTTLVVTIEAELDRLEANMRAAGRIVDTTTSGMDKSTKRAAIAVSKLEASFNPATRAARRLETDSRKVQQALDKGAITSQKAAELQKRLNDQYERGASSARRMGRAVEAGTSRLSAGVSRQRSLALATQNSAYQIGDFAVQVAAGTDATRALAMQLPQLLGGFGVLGAVLGAVAAIAGALVPVFWDGAGATKEAAKEAEKYAEALKEAQREIEKTARMNASIWVGDLADPYEIAVDKARIKIDQLRESLESQGRAQNVTGISLERYVNALVNGSDEAEAFAEAQDALNKALKIQADRADRSITAMVKENAYREDGLALLRGGLITLEDYEARQKAVAEAARLGIPVRDTVTRSLTDQYKALLAATKATMALDKAEQDLKKTDTDKFVTTFGDDAADYGALGDPDEFYKRMKKRSDAEDRAAEKINQQHAKMRAASGGAVDELNTWRDESLAGLNTTAVGYEEFVRQVEEIYTQRLPDAKRKDLDSSREWSDGAQRAFMDYEDSVTNHAARAEQAVTNSMKGMEDGLIAWTSRTKSAGDSFRSFANGVIQDMQRMLIQQNVTGPLSGFLGTVVKGFAGSLTGSVTSAGFSQGMFQSNVSAYDAAAAFGAAAADGKVFAGGNVVPFANGGAFTNSIVSKPTLFPMARGATGLMGEAGPEAVIPLARGTDGKLGVRSSGGGGGGAVYLTDARTITVSGNGVTRADVDAALAAAKPKWTRDAVEQSKMAVQRENRTNPTYFGV